MPARLAALAAASFACLACWPGPGGATAAESRRDIPAAVRAEHEGVLRYLHRIADRPTPVGTAARKVLDLLEPHMAVEEELVLPPLVLLPDIAAGKVTPEMRWAIVLADRLQTRQAGMLRTHEALSDAFIALMDAAQTENDQDTVNFTQDMAADDLGDREVTEPLVIVIGKVLRGRLPAP